MKKFILLKKNIRYWKIKKIICKNKIKSTDKDTLIDTKYRNKTKSSKKKKN